MSIEGRLYNVKSTQNQRGLNVDHGSIPHLCKHSNGCDR